MSDTKLNPCWYCGENMTMSECDGKYWTWCENCATSGPTEDTKKEAAEAWNAHAVLESKSGPGAKTLRDEIAMAALNIIHLHINNYPSAENSHTYGTMRFTEIANQAYGIADAMLAEREKGKSDE